MNHMLDIIKEIDETTLRFVQNNFNNELVQDVLVLITRLGDMGAIWVAPGIALACTKEHRRNGIEMLATLAACGTINSLVIKNIVDRNRPFDVHLWLNVLVSKPTDFSFPSGHTASSFAAAYFLSKAYGKKIGIPAYTLATAIGLTRIGVGVHYPSDVIAGAAVGTAVAIGASKLAKRFWKKYEKKQKRDQ